MHPIKTLNIIVIKNQNPFESGAIKISFKKNKENKKLEKLETIKNNGIKIYIPKKH